MRGRVDFFVGYSPFLLNLRTIRIKDMYNSRRKLEQHGHGPSSETRGECREDWEWFFLAGEKTRLSEGFIHVLYRPSAS